MPQSSPPTPADYARALIDQIQRSYRGADIVEHTCRLVALFDSCTITAEWSSTHLRVKFSPPTDISSTGWLQRACELYFRIEMFPVIADRFGAPVTADHPMAVVCHPLLS
jgi:hypothetical protein